MSKTLIISTWAPPMPGGPQSLYNIFSVLPKDSYSILTSGHNISACLRKPVVGKWLPCQYYFYDYTPTSNREGKLDDSPQPKNNSSIRTRTVALVKRIPFIGQLVYDFIVLLYLTLKFYRAAIRIAKENHTELLLGLSDKGPALIATWLAAKSLRLPYIIYLYDIYLGNNLNLAESLFARFFEPAILKGAKTLLLTNEGTEQYYQRRYGKSISTAVIHNSTFTSLYASNRTPYAPQMPYQIVFTGHVEWPQEQSVLNLVSAMNKLKDIPLTLELYIPSPSVTILQAVKHSQNIHLLSASPENMPVIQNSATLLFLPLAWNTRAPDIIATATPGKFTDYLASGRPILVHAPEYAFVSQYVKAHQAGIVVDTNNVDQLANTIRMYLCNTSQGNLYIRKALDLFHSEYEVETNAKRLGALLNVGTGPKVTL